MILIFIDILQLGDQESITQTESQHFVNAFTLSKWTKTKISYNQYETLSFY